MIIWLRRSSDVDSALSRVEVRDWSWRRYREVKRVWTRGAPTWYVIYIIGGISCSTPRTRDRPGGPTSSCNNLSMTPQTTPGVSSSSLKSFSASASSLRLFSEHPLSILGSSMTSAFIASIMDRSGSLIISPYCSSIVASPMDSQLCDLQVTRNVAVAHLDMPRRTERSHPASEEDRLKSCSSWRLRSRGGDPG